MPTDTTTATMCRAIPDGITTTTHGFGGVPVRLPAPAPHGGLDPALGDPVRECTEAPVLADVITEDRLREVIEDMEVAADLQERRMRPDSNPGALFFFSERAFLGDVAKNETDRWF